MLCLKVDPKKYAEEFNICVDCMIEDALITETGLDIGRSPDVKSS